MSQAGIKSLESPPLDVSVIIVSNNHCRYLDTCLGSLLQHATELRLEVFVVDNLSTDGTVEFVRRRYPQVGLIPGQIKRGFSANNNLAIRASQGRYLLILNPDTEITPGALDGLISFMDQHPEVGVCGPQLRFPDGNLQYSCRAFPTWRSVIVRRTPLRIFLRDSAINRRHLLQDMDHQQRQEVDWLLGACLLIRREMLDQVGLFDEHYFLYVEDIDYCLRVHQAGWQVWYVPEAVIIHHHLATSDKHFLSKHTRYHFASMLHFFGKYRLPRTIQGLAPLVTRAADMLAHTQQDGQTKAQTPAPATVFQDYHHDGA